MNEFDKWFNEYSKRNTQADREHCLDAYHKGMLAAARLAEPQFPTVYSHGNKKLAEVIANNIRGTAKMTKENLKKDFKERLKIIDSFHPLEGC